uniref:Nostrin n=1 Tax=Culex tarsalis TaxID=7177 RepID=A0A1Q3G0L6_CULTA
MKKHYSVEIAGKYGGRSPSNILDKITKRYSAIGSRLMRKSPGRKSGVAEPITGSYDMSGGRSDDFRPEIGVPVLISKTLKFDFDQVPSSRPGTPTPARSSQSPLPVSVTTTRSSSDDSSNDVFVDANSSLPNLPDIRFTFLPESNNNYSTYIDEHDKENLQRNRSKSAHNLHQPELRLCLENAPSLNLSAISNGALKSTSVTVPNSPAVDSIYDFPRASTKIGESPYDLEQAHLILNEINLSLVSEGDPHNLYNNLPNGSHVTSSNGVLHNNAFDYSGSNQSIHSGSTQEEEFDLKSASFQSLNARHLFMSIEELDEITRQINESDIFKEAEEPNEYCEHRNQLHPSERRLTLLKNKTAPKHFIDFDKKKAKLTRKWSGFKHWIGEEQDKIKEVVQKHAAMQRVGGKHGAGGSEVGSESDAVMVASASVVVESETGQGSEAKDRTNDSEERDESRKRKSYSAEILEGQNGFEEIRRFVKQGGDFGKDLITILQERTEIEQIYAKSLSKIANKLNKACRDLPGTIAESWRAVSTEIESRGEVHRQFSNSLADELVKPLKSVLENQHKARKAIENNVDKSARILAEWRAAELKAKKGSHQAARENEKLQDAMLDVKLQRSPSLGLLHKTIDKESKSSEKDSSKLDTKRKKAEESVKKADVEYYTLCIRAERARVDWEMSVLRGSSMLQSLENQRLSHFKNYVSSYFRLASEMNPVLAKIADRLGPQVQMCNVQKDLEVLKNIRRATEGPSEQLLPDFYCEHTTLAMNRERRKQSLVKLLQLIRQDLDRERRSRNGLKGFTQNFESNVEGNQNIADKLYHIRSMLTYLEGARYKLQSALFELDHKPRSSHPLAQHIQITRDRTGLQTSVLKVPLWLKNEQDENDDGQVSAAAAVNGNGNCGGGGGGGSGSGSENGEPQCVDIKNDTLIKHMAKKYGRNEEDHYSLHKSSKPSTPPDENSPVWDRGVADGVSNQPDSDFDEFSSQDEEEDRSSTSTGGGGVVLHNGNGHHYHLHHQHHHNGSDTVDNGIGGETTTTTTSTTASTTPGPILGRCRALFNYTPKLYDELELQPGDLLDIHIKQEDGWWLGALRGQVGIFPATYVEEID